MCCTSLALFWLQLTLWGNHQAQKMDLAEVHPPNAQKMDCYVSTIVVMSKTAPNSFAASAQQLYKLLLQSKVNAKTVQGAQQVTRTKTKK